MTPKQQIWKLQAEKVIKKMARRRFTGYYCETKEAALEKALSLMPKGSSVANGGSVTLNEIGLLPYLNEHPEEYHFIDRKKAKNHQETREIHAQTMMADYFLMSTNAFTQEGELVNIDGNGNRVSALCFGPEHVIIIVSMNKLVPDVETAYKRIRQNACPPNAARIGLNTPCNLTGFCSECTSHESMCASFVTTRMTRYDDRIHVILVGEELGF